MPLPKGQAWIWRHRKRIGNNRCRPLNNRPYNSGMDNDGWTLLEDYLEFMANPYIVLKSGENGSMNLTEHFKGFTKTPVFAIEIVDGGDCLKASVDGNTLNITTS